MHLGPCGGDDVAMLLDVSRGYGGVVGQIEVVAFVIVIIGRVEEPSSLNMSR
jgi:hypothetical protein